MFEELKVLLLVAIRNLALHKVKTAVVGGILLAGSFLVVFGLSILGSIENTMSQSIIGSVAGHLQVYSQDAKDELALFGSGFFGRDDLGEIPKSRRNSQKPKCCKYRTYGFRKRDHWSRKFAR